MEAIRKFMDASSLMSIMNLPDTFRNRRLEVIVLPAEEYGKELDREARANDIKNAIQTLVGSIPDTDMSLSELREERFCKIGVK